jgi:hypothetical protein
MNDVNIDLGQIGEMVKTVAEPVNAVGVSVAENIVTPIIKPTGETAALIPRVIHAAFSPIEKWVLNQEYSIKETKLILEKKLANIAEEDIVTPEPYITVPAIQAMSYSMDNHELRELFANLLASAMNKNLKADVHTSYVEIIKQLMPDEAKILREMSILKECPLLSVRFVMKNSEEFTDSIQNFSAISYDVDCNFPDKICEYIDNLTRLGLVKTSNSGYLTDKDYDILISHSLIQSYSIINEELKKEGYTKVVYKKGYMELTALGKAFCKICLPDNLSDKN